MTTYTMTYGTDSATVILGVDPSSPIVVDGQEIGRQFGDASCRTADAMRLAADWAFGDDGPVDWDEVAYEPVAPSGPS